jgi:hypothetical protein
MANPPPDNVAPVEDYYDKIHGKTWGRRTSGFIAGATLFGGFGMVGGAIAAFLPYALGAAGIAGAAAVAAPGALVIASNAALFGGAAAWLGMTIGADVGSNAGSVAAGLEEKEKREKSGQPAVAQSQAATTAKPPRLFNWKVGLVMGLMFAAFGALIALNPITASTVALMGFAAASPAASVASASVLGMFGATMGVNFPYLSNKISNYYSRLLKGKTFEKTTDSEAAASLPLQPAVQQAPELQAPAAAQDAQVKETRSFASDKMRFSLNGILEKTEERATQEITTTR